MNNQIPAADNIVALSESITRLTVESTAASISSQKRKKIESHIKVAIDELTALLATLDPIAQPTAVFDPSNPEVVGRFVALALVAQERHPLTDIPKFYGSGVYAIYYKGSFAAYKTISGTETPIYVGQASPALSNARSPSEQGAKLCGRLTDHRKNIGKASSTLNLADFEFRSLVT